MVYVDPATGKRYAEPGDYFGDEFATLSGMSATLRARYIGTGTPRCTIDGNSNTIPDGYLLGNSTPGTFVLAGVGVRAAADDATNIPTRNFATDEDGLARLQQYVTDYLGADYGSQVNSTDVYLAAVPGGFKVGSKFWSAGQAWPTVHPLLIPTNVRVSASVGDVFNPFVFEMNAAGGLSTPRWVRWLFRRSIPAGERVSSFPTLQTTAASDSVIEFPGGRIPPSAYVYYRFSDPAGVGATTSAGASSGYGLSQNLTNILPFGNHRGVAGMVRVTPSTVGASSDFQPYTTTAPRVNWDRDKPFRIRLYVVESGADSSSATGEDVFAESGVQLWYDVEVTKASAIGPELPGKVEPLLVESRPRVTSRIRLRTGIDGGAP